MQFVTQTSMKGQWMRTESIRRNDTESRYTTIRLTPPWHSWTCYAQSPEL